MLPLGRRSLLAGAAGSAALFAAPAAVRAQALAPPQAGPAGGGRSAVIDVNRARTDPIPIAIPALGGGGGNAAQLGQDIATVVTNDLARSGLFRPISQQAFIQAGAGRVTRRISRTGRRSARRRWSPAVPRRREADRPASSSACGTCCRRPRSRAPPTPPARPTGGASPISSPTSSTNGCSARRAISTPASSISPRPARAAGRPSASPSWIRTARTIAS